MTKRSFYYVFLIAYIIFALYGCEDDEAALSASAEYRMDECSWDGSSEDVIDSSVNAFHASSYLVDTEDVSSLGGQMCKRGNFLTDADTAINLPKAVIHGRSVISFSAWIKTDLVEDQYIVSSINTSDDRGLSITST